MRISTPSRTLRQAMTASHRFILHEGHQFSIHIPHYWAIYYHDGSGPITMPKGRYMVWFKDPKDDPRLKNGYPVKKSDIRRLNLSRERFTQFLKDDKIIIRRSVGKRKGSFFTHKAKLAWEPWIRTELRRRTAEEILRILEPLKKLREI